MPTVATMTGPGTITITDDAAAAIALQTTEQQTSFNAIIAQIGSPVITGSLIACLSGINDSLTRIADTDALIAKKISDINIAMGSMAVAQASLTSVTAITAANQIETNNFQKQATKDALTRAGLPEPVLPELTDQLQTSVVSGVALNQAAVAGGAVTAFITSNTAALGTWIGQTKVYTTVANFLSDAADSVLAVLPASVRSTLAKAKGGV